MTGDWIRPEAAARLSRWREALIGMAFLGLGAWLLPGGGLWTLFGLAALGTGGVLALSGLRRARFRHATDAPGLLELDEGRLTYLGPVLGGTVAVDELAEVTFRRTRSGEAFWRLAPVSGRALIVPEGAAGAERLLDALAPLPGFDAGALVRATRAPAPATVTVWRRPSRAALT